MWVLVNHAQAYITLCMAEVLGLDVAHSIIHLPFQILDVDLQTVGELKPFKFRVDHTKEDRLVNSFDSTPPLRKPTVSSVGFFILQ